MSTPPRETSQGYDPVLVEFDGPLLENPGDYTGTEADVPSPTDAEVRRMMARIRKARAIYTRLLGLATWVISWTYTRNQFPESHKNAAMYVNVRWQYMSADVFVSIDACYDDDWPEICRKVAHELSHCLVEPLVAHTDHDLPKHRNKHVEDAVERLVTQIARAVVSAHAEEPDDDDPALEAPAPLDPDPWAIS